MSLHNPVLEMSGPKHVFSGICKETRVPVVFVPPTLHGSMLVLSQSFGSRLYCQSIYDKHFRGEQYETLVQEWWLLCTLHYTLDARGNGRRFNSPFFSSKILKIISSSGIKLMGFVFYGSLPHGNLRWMDFIRKTCAGKKLYSVAFKSISNTLLAIIPIWLKLNTLFPWRRKVMEIIDLESGLACNVAGPTC